MVSNIVSMPLRSWDPCEIRPSHGVTGVSCRSPRGAKSWRKDIADQITIELVRHSVAEEVLFYSQVHDDNLTQRRRSPSLLDAPEARVAAHMSRPGFAQRPPRATATT